MSLTSADVRKIAHLARLAITDEEVPVYARELSAILQMVEHMQSVDTSAIEPMAHPLDVTQRLRPDLVTESDQRERLQVGAPHTQNGLYLVPKVIE